MYQRFEINPIKYNKTIEVEDIVSGYIANFVRQYLLLAHLANEKML